MNKKVLVIDDEEMIRRILRTYLAKWGFLVTEASDGEEALQEMAKDNFDLLICDILMPRKNGWEVLQEVKSNPQTKDIPVIVLTAKNEEPDMFKGYDLGANYYMIKPFTRAQLRYGVELMFERDSAL